MADEDELEGSSDVSVTVSAEDLVLQSDDGFDDDTGRARQADRGKLRAIDDGGRRPSLPINIPPPSTLSTSPYAGTSAHSQLHAQFGSGSGSGSPSPPYQSPMDHSPLRKDSSTPRGSPSNAGQIKPLPPHPHLPYGVANSDPGPGHTFDLEYIFGSKNHPTNPGGSNMMMIVPPNYDAYLNRNDGNGDRDADMDLPLASNTLNANANPEHDLKSLPPTHSHSHTHHQHSQHHPHTHNYTQTATSGSGPSAGFVTSPAAHLSSFAASVSAKLRGKPKMRERKVASYDSDSDPSDEDGDEHAARVGLGSHGGGGRGSVLLGPVPYHGERRLSVSLDSGVKALSMEASGYSAQRYTSSGTKAKAKGSGKRAASASGRRAVDAYENPMIGTDGDGMYAAGAGTINWKNPWGAPQPPQSPSASISTSSSVFTSPGGGKTRRPMTSPTLSTFSNSVFGPPQGTSLFLPPRSPSFVDTSAIVSPHPSKSAAAASAGSQEEDTFAKFVSWGDEEYRDRRAEWSFLHVSNTAPAPTPGASSSTSLVGIPAMNRMDGEFVPAPVPPRMRLQDVVDGIATGIGGTAMLVDGDKTPTTMASMAQAQSQSIDPLQGPGPLDPEANPVGVWECGTLGRYVVAVERPEDILNRGLTPVGLSSGGLDSSGRKMSLFVRRLSESADAAPTTPKAEPEPTSMSEVQNTDASVSPKQTRKKSSAVRVHIHKHSKAPAHSLFLGSDSSGTIHKSSILLATKKVHLHLSAKKATAVQPTTSTSGTGEVEGDKEMRLPRVAPPLDYVPNFVNLEVLEKEKSLSPQPAPAHARALATPLPDDSMQVDGESDVDRGRTSRRDAENSDVDMMDGRVTSSSTYHQDFGTITPETRDAMLEQLK